MGMTIAAIVFAVTGGLGLTNFAKSILFAASIGGSFMPLVEFYYWWKREGFEGY